MNTHTRRRCPAALALLATGGFVLFTAPEACGQVFTNLSGFGIGSGNGAVIGPSGPVMDSASINAPMFPGYDYDTATVGIGSRGSGYAEIVTFSGFDSGMINLQSRCLGQGGSICDNDHVCGNGTGSGTVTTRVNFRVSEPAVLELTANIDASTHLDLAFGSASGGATTTLTVVEGTSTTLFGREVRTTTEAYIAETIPRGGIARLAPGVDYRLNLVATGHAESFGWNSSAYGSANGNVNIRLFPAACPTVSSVQATEHCASQPATFSVSPAGVAPFTYQWQFLQNDGFWYDLTNGFVAGVGTVGGAATDTLTITNAVTAGRFFRCRVENDCGRAFSPPAVTVLVSSDFNHDGDVGTDQDIEAFFACLAGNCCLTCPVNADFNGDGDVGTDADIESFFRVLAGGNC